MGMHADSTIDRLDSCTCKDFHTSCIESYAGPGGASPGVRGRFI